MATLEKTYNLPPAILWHAINDIVEMRRAKIKHFDNESMVIDTEMYRIKTAYVFRVVHAVSGYTIVSMETNGESEEDKRSIQLMFSTLDSILAPFMQ